MLLGAPVKARKPTATAVTYVLDGPLDFLRLLWAVEHALQMASQRMERELGVTGPQRFMLRIIGRHPSISPSELAAVMHLHKSTVSGLLRRLERKDLVLRTADPVDGRRYLVRLSERGKRVAERRSGTVEAGVRRVLAKLSPATIRATRTAFAALVDELG